MSGAFGSGRGLSGEDGAAGPAGPNRAFAFLEIAADDAGGAALDIATLAIETVASGRLVIDFALNCQSPDGNTFLTVKINGGAYSNVTLISATIMTGTNAGVRHRAIVNVMGSTVYTVIVNVSPQLTDFFWDHGSLSLEEVVSA